MNGCVEAWCKTLRQRLVRSQHCSTYFSASINDLNKIPSIFLATLLHGIRSANILQIQVRIPKKGAPEWPALETLVLYNISIKAVDLIHLIDVRMLNLLHLRIGEIRLLEGTWEGVFECLKGSDPLLSIRFDRKNAIYHRYGES